MYVDESGFEADSYRPYAWSLRGKKSYGNRKGTRYARTNLIAAKRGKALLAPVLYQGSTTAKWFNHWLKNELMHQLNSKSTVIMDNAAFHKKVEIKNILESSGHQALFLPPYSPDLNPIEQDFAIMKKRRAYAKAGTTIDEIVKKYGLLLE